MVAGLPREMGGHREPPLPGGRGYGFALGGCGVFASCGSRERSLVFRSVRAGALGDGGEAGRVSLVRCPGHASGLRSPS